MTKQIHPFPNVNIQCILCFISLLIELIFSIAVVLVTKHHTVTVYKGGFRGIVCKRSKEERNQVKTSDNLIQELLIVWMRSEEYP